MVIRKLVGLCVTLVFVASSVSIQAEQLPISGNIQAVPSAL